MIRVFFLIPHFWTGWKRRLMFDQRESRGLFSAEFLARSVSAVAAHDARSRQRPPGVFFLPVSSARTVSAVMHTYCK